ncbi:MAG: DegT/DnrJ/EryC1/StrS family aminotransferase [Nitrospiraceae bacterium]|nr:DegT/DnrJ/EryC1/StrS family aminotransferase [Nitrospiraceae bacterium]
MDNMQARRIQVGDFRMDADEKEAILDVINGGRISEWQKTKEFEKVFANYIGTKHCLAVSSGTSALILGLLALFYDDRFPKARKGAKIITSPVTYISTASAIVLSGYEPVFVDIDEKTFKLKTEEVRNAIEQHGPGNVAGILPVHLMGYPNDLDELIEIANEYDLFVFEDSAQAHGSLYKGKRTGSLGLLSDFSFYIAHNIQAGEMGCITTNDGRLYRLMKQLKANGRACNCILCTRSKGECPGIKKYDGMGDYDPRFTHEYITYNFKVTEFTSALALSQMKKAEWIFQSRSKNVKYLTEQMKQFDHIFSLPPYDPDVSYLAYTLIIKPGSHVDRKNLRKALEDHGIETRPLFGCIPTQQPAFSYLKSQYEGRLPVADYIGSHAFYIGCHQYMEKTDLDYILDVFSDILKQNRD